MTGRVIVGGLSVVRNGRQWDVFDSYLGSLLIRAFVFGNGSFCLRGLLCVFDFDSVDCKATIW